jgi:hypothetical protein
MAALFSGVVLLVGPKIYAWMGGAGETHSAALASAFQAAGCARWSIIAVALRAVIVVSGGWLVIRFGGADFSAITLVAAAGLVAYGTVLIAAFLTTSTPREKANAGASRS